jgi:hypothetical protein
VITARAIGVLEELVISSSVGGAKALSHILGEGRDAIQSAINELRDLGYLETVKNRLANGAVVSTIQVTEAGYQFLVSRSHILLSQLNSYLILDTNSINKQIKSTEQVREDYTKVVDIKIGASIMDDDVFPDYDNLEEYRAKMMAKKKAEYTAAKEAQKAQQYVTRINRPKSAWSPSDSAFEFGYRVGQLWHIPEWRVGNSRFAFALAEFRKKYDTDGELECALMDLFFESVKHETSIKDGEVLWRMFIKRAPSMVEQARASLYSVDVMETQKEVEDMYWKGF